MRRFYALLLAIAATGVLVSASQAQQYSLTVLKDPWMGNTMLSGLNDRGDIVGNVLDQSGDPLYGFIYSNNTFTKIQAPGAARTRVSAVNNSGQVVGSYSNHETFREFDSYGFMYQGGSFNAVNVPNPRNAGTYPTDINNSGTIAGWYDWGVEDFFGFSYDGNTYRDVYAGWETFVDGISGNGNIIGDYQFEIDLNHGFIHDGTGFKDFTYPGAYDTYISGVSDSGMILGSYTLPVYDPMYPDWPYAVISGGSFLWNGADFERLDIPGASDVNSNGWIVGSYPEYGDFSQYAGILAIPAGNAGNRSAPVPEPATMLLMGGAFAGILGASRKFARNRAYA